MDDDGLNLNALNCPKCGTRVQGLRSMLVCRYCKVEYDENMTARPLEPLPKLPEPASRALNKAGILLINDLSRWSEADLLKLHGIGPKTIHLLHVNATQS